MTWTLWITLMVAINIAGVASEAELELVYSDLESVDRCVEIVADVQESMPEEAYLADFHCMNVDY